jgi:hypothetical protein
VVLFDSFNKTINGKERNGSTKYEKIDIYIYAYASCSMVVTSVVLLTINVDPWSVLMSVGAAHVGQERVCIAMAVIRMYHCIKF